MLDDKNLDLFVINRYYGDSDDKETPDEDKLKKKFLKKIKERKRLSQACQFSEDINPKKAKYSESSGLNNSLEENSNELVAESEQNAAVNNVIEENIDDEGSSNNYDINGKDDIEEKGSEPAGFTVLRDIHISKREKVKRKLPDWLANPSVVSVDLKNLSCPVDSIPELDSIFVDKLKENNISHFFPVQSQIIPWFLKNADRPYIYWPNDICVSAPTGSGKTLAFVLPILQVLHKRIVPRIRAIIVLPVQDLASQVFRVLETYSKPTKLKVLLLSKKRRFEEEQSLICKDDGTGNYKSLVDIIVTTPGRLVDHLTKTKGLCLDDLTYLVIDEADRVMENIQNDWLYHLNKRLSSEFTRSYQMPFISYNNMINRKRPPQKLLFSATLSQDPEKLQQLGLFQPKMFTSVVKTETVKDDTKFIGKYTTPAELTEYYVVCTKANKPLIINHLLRSRSWKNVLCFVNSVEAAHRLAFVLKKLNKNKLKIEKLSSNLTIMKRDSVLNKFSKGKVDILVSSDALARGIDVPNVDYVISYDAPKFVKTYVHRIGRTGRAGKEGTSLVLLTSKEVTNFQKMIETAGKDSVRQLDINSKELEEYEASYETALTALRDNLENKKQKLLLKLKAKNKLQIKASRGKFTKSYNYKK